MDTAADVNLQAVSLHSDGRLREARLRYGEVLALNPPREPTAPELERVDRYAPILYTTPTEPLPLRDVVAVIHPTEPLIGYHLFWEDDIDFPDDDEPTDHEQVWVAWSPTSGMVTGLYAWYHSHLIQTKRGVITANRAGARPVVYVQWGKHGSLLTGWQEMEADGRPLLADMRETYERLHTEGRRLADYPAARHWPRRFTGTWDEFIDFTTRVDTLSWLRRKRMVTVSRWANASINQLFLLYNFCPKWEWPPTP